MLLVLSGGHPTFVQKPIAKTSIGHSPDLPQGLLDSVVVVDELELELIRTRDEDEVSSVPEVSDWTKTSMRAVPSGLVSVRLKSPPDGTA